MEDILERSKYYRRIYAICARAHHLTSQRKAGLNHLFGIPAVIISAIVGTTVFATLQENPSETARVIVGLVLIAAAVLSTLQTWFNHADMASKHKHAGTKYSAMRRRLELFELKYATTAATREAAIVELEGILEDLEKLADDLPAIPDSMWDRAKLEYDRDNVTEQEPEQGGRGYGSPAAGSPSPHR